MDILNGTDVKGQILFCTMQPGDEDVFQQASQYVLDGGGSGVIFAQYTTDLSFTALDVCQGIACVLVDLDIGKKIASYMDDARYAQKVSFLCNESLSLAMVTCKRYSDRRRELFRLAQECEDLADLCLWAGALPDAVGADALQGADL